MIDYEYAKYITEIILDEDQSEKLMTLRFDALRQLRGVANYYEKQHLLSWLIEKAFCKKADFILKATTKREIEQILKPSLPNYSCGRLIFNNKFHVEEEELLLWSITSLNAGRPLVPEANKRYMELFEKIVGGNINKDVA